VLAPSDPGMNFATQAYFILALFMLPPIHIPPMTNASRKLRKTIVSAEIHGREALGKRNMNTAGQIAVTLAALIGFGRLFLADEGDSHRLSGLLILAGLVGKVALSI
jgi:hypothetical protein